MRYRIQLLIVPLFIELLKVVFASILYYLPGHVYAVAMHPDWLHLFAAWDAAYYHELAVNWYPTTVSPVWAYFPAYPAIVRLVGLLGPDPWLAGFLVAQIAGCASILVFQRVAFAYFGRDDSSSSTVLYFLLPPVFVFTTVSYSESLFLFFSLMMWYSHIKGRKWGAAFFASLTVLTRAYGLLILVPLGYDFLRSRQFRSLAFLTFPLAAVVGWLSYGYYRAGNFLAPFSAQSYWNTETVLQIRENMSRLITHSDPVMFRLLFRFQFLIIFSIFFLGLIAWLCIRTWKIDRSLGVYSSTFLLALGCLTSIFIQAFVSLPRFLSLIFPFGLSLKCKKTWLFIVTAGLFASFDLLAWWMFLFTESFH